jgi:hypothetical protein
MRLLGAPAIPAPGLHPFLNQVLRRIVGDIGGSHWRQLFNLFHSTVIVERISIAPLDKRVVKRDPPPRLAIVF